MTFLPTPNEVQWHDATTNLPNPLTFSTAEEGRNAVEVFRQRLRGAITFEEDSDAFLTIEIDESLPAEGYRLEAGDTVRIAAADRQGAGWAIQTLLQLMPPKICSPGPWLTEDLHYACATISDAPRFRWRGAHLDPSRHFHSAEFVLKFLDVMALHKLNVLHWHLTDDQGWRIPIPEYPKLTEQGAWRPGTMIGAQKAVEDEGVRKEPPHDGIPHGGAYTEEDIRRVVERAELLGITVMPEVDMPGHMEAVVACYPELGCGSGVTHPRTWFGISEHVLNLTEPAIEFCNTVIDRVMELFPGSPIHLGGDECPGGQWFTHEPTRERLAALGISTAAEAQAWFGRQMCQRVIDAGRRVVVWDEVLEQGGAPDGTTVMVWRRDKDITEAIDAGFDAIAAPTTYTYLDYTQAEGPAEPMPTWTIRPLDEVEQFHTEWAGIDSQRLLGGQFQLWSENLRTPAMVEYFAFPRGSSIAEQLWAGTNKLEATPENYAEPMARLTAMGVNWRRF